MYAKVFTSLWKGTLRGSGPTWAVFVYLLANADRDGVVDVVPAVIRDDTGFTAEQVAAALAQLSAPDPDSRTPDEDGRRLLPLDAGRSWGWQIVNFERYHAMRNEDERRAANRVRMAAVRARAHVCASVHRGAPTQTQTQTHTQTESKASAAASAAAPVDTISSLPTLDGEHAVTREDGDRLAAAYPSADVPQELRKMVAWLVANPNRRPTARGLGRFMLAWIRKAHNEGSSAAARGARGGRAGTDQRYATQQAVDGQGGRVSRGTREG